MEYPKSVTQRTQMVASSNSVESSYYDVSNKNKEEGEHSLTVNMPHSFPLLSPSGFFLVRIIGLF